MNKKGKQRKRQRQRQRIAAENQIKGKRSFWFRFILVGLFVATLGFLIAIGVWKFFLSDNEPSKSLSHVYNSQSLFNGEDYREIVIDKEEEIDLAAKPAPIINESHRQKVIQRLASKPVSQEFSPVHIFKGNLWVGTGTLHEPSQMIATSEHLFPTDQPDGYFTYRYPWELLPETMKDVKYLSFANPLDQFENTDIAVANVGPRTEIAGFSDYDIELFSNFVALSLPKTLELTSLTDGSKTAIMAALVLPDEFEKIKAQGGSTNRFIFLADHAIIKGESGTGFIGVDNGRTYLFVQSGFWQDWPEDIKQRVIEAFKIQADQINNICIVYAFPMDLFK